MREVPTHLLPHFPCTPQHIEVIELHARDSRLLELLKKYSNAQHTNRIIIFVLYKKEAPRVESLLQRNGWKVGLLGLLASGLLGHQPVSRRCEFCGRATGNRTGPYHRDIR